MKRLSLILVCLALFIGVSPGRAFAGADGHDDVATLANDAGLALEGMRRDTEAFYEATGVVAGEEAVDGNVDAGLLICHFTDGCGYVVNPHVMIDLQYSIVRADETERIVARNAVAGDRFLPNLLLGVHVSF